MTSPAPRASTHSNATLVPRPATRASDSRPMRRLHSGAGSRKYLLHKAQPHEALLETPERLTHMTSQISTRSAHNTTTGVISKSRAKANPRQRMAWHGRTWPAIPQAPTYMMAAATSDPQRTQTTAHPHDRLAPTSSLTGALLPASPIRRRMPRPRPRPMPPWQPPTTNPPP